MSTEINLIKLHHMQIKLHNGIKSENTFAIRQSKLEIKHCLLSFLWRSRVNSKVFSFCVQPRECSTLNIMTQTVHVA